MGNAACKFCTGDLPEEVVVKKRQTMTHEGEEVKPKRHKQAQQSPQQSMVLSNFDLLQQILSKLVGEHGCNMKDRARIAQVSKLWRDVAKLIPVDMSSETELSDSQWEAMASGKVPSVQRLSLQPPGSSVYSPEDLLQSSAFQISSAETLRTVVGAPLTADIDWVHSFSQLRHLSLERPESHSILGILRGTRYYLRSIEHLKHLTHLELQNFCGPQSRMDLAHLPTCLKHLKLKDSSMIHHPEMEIPKDLHLNTLSATCKATRALYLPVKLLCHAREASLRGKMVGLCGVPTVVPELEADSMEIYLDAGMMLVFTQAVEQTEHESDTSAILQTLKSSDLQKLEVTMEQEGALSIVSRTDCRQGLRYKTVETGDANGFLTEAVSLCKSPEAGFQCQVGEEQDQGSAQRFRMIRK